MSVVESLAELIEAILHIDQYLPFVLQLNDWVYPLLFAISFFETGAFLLSIVPGDALLFAAGSFTAAGVLNLPGLLAVTIVAVVLGDSLNYFLGDRVGRPLLRGHLPILPMVVKEEHMVRAERFFEVHGRKAVLIARFIPVIRPLTPFVAGIASMPFGRFLKYNLLGAIIWVGVFVLAGFFFGNAALVRENLPLFLIAIAILSAAPALLELGRERTIASKNQEEPI